MNILVTGGAGYLGSTLVNLLAITGAQIRVLDSLLHKIQPLEPVLRHPNLEFIEGDIRDHVALSAALKDIEAVVHLAAIVGDPACSRNPEEARDINLLGSRLLLEQARRSGVRRFIFASTCSNYGRMPGCNAYVDEASPLAPLSVYADTKVEFERELLALPCDGMSVVSLRFATLYGVSPRMRFDLTVNEFTLDILCKKHLVVFGEQSWRPYVHVRDAAGAIVQVLHTPQHVNQEVFNVGATDQNFRKRDLVNLICAHSSDAHVEYITKADDLRNYRVCFDKISRRLGFAPERTVEHGIAEIAHFVRKNPGERFDSPVFRN